MYLLSGAEIKCPLSVLERVRIIEIFFERNMLGIRIREVSVRRGSTVFPLSVYKNFYVIMIG